MLLAGHRWRRRGLAAIPSNKGRGLRSPIGEQERRRTAAPLVLLVQGGRDSWFDGGCCFRCPAVCWGYSSGKSSQAIQVHFTQDAAAASPARPVMLTRAYAALPDLVHLDIDVEVAAGFRNPYASRTRVGGPRDDRRLSCCHNTRLGAYCRQPPFRHRAGVRHRSASAPPLARSGAGPF
jgi:hypothetical protein